MRRWIIAAFLVLLLPATAAAGWFDSWDKGWRLNSAVAELTFAPPHNEPVLPGSRYVARYRATLDLDVSWRIFGFDVQENFWGLNEWRPPNEVGHGFPDAWEGSDFRLQGVRVQSILRSTVDLYTTGDTTIQFLWEHQEWSEWKDERKDYWNLVGFRLKFK